MKGVNNNMGQQQRVGTHRTSTVTLEGLTSVVYHSTAVVQFDNDKIS